MTYNPRTFQLPDRLDVDRLVTVHSETSSIFDLKVRSPFRHSGGPQRARVRLIFSPTWPDAMPNQHSVLGQPLDMRDRLPVF